VRRSGGRRSGSCLPGVTEYSNRLELIGAVFAPDPYGIALTEGSELREPVNWALLEMSRDGAVN